MVKSSSAKTPRRVTKLVKDIPDYEKPYHGARKPTPEEASRHLKPPTSTEPIKTASGGSIALKDDSDKLPIDLFPGDALFAITTILQFGAIKYAPRNWEKGFRWGRVFAALMRHMWMWWQGSTNTKTNFFFGDLDVETGYSHLWHAGCCMVFLISHEERRIGEDDRPKQEQENK